MPKKLKKLKLKPCPACKQALPLTDFNKDSSTKDGLCAYCRICKNTQQMRHHRRRKYGLSNEDYLEKALAQGYACDLCHELFVGEGIGDRPCVDHDHKTGKIRGILHARCNLWLPPIENEEFKKLAEAYLLKWKEPPQQETPVS